MNTKSFVLFLVALFLVLPATLSAQTEDDYFSPYITTLPPNKVAIGSFGNQHENALTDNPAEHEWKVVEQMPSFPGGIDALVAYLSENVYYPLLAQANGIEGRVIVEFIVTEDGSITDAQVAVSVDPLLDDEAVRVVNSMPKWIPGKAEGKPIRVKYSLPVSFRL